MAGRNIPIALADNWGERSLSRCRLMKVTTAAGDTFGLCSLDRDVEYDDGTGERTYKAISGFDTYAVETASDLSVDNSEGGTLMAEAEVDGFTLDAIRRGVYDDARFVAYAVDFDDLSAGHVVINGGTLGKVRVVNGKLCYPEMRSLSQTLKQKSVIEKGSNNCRATFGDARCKFDVDSLWVDAEIVAVGAETDRVVTVDGAALTDDDLRFGLIEIVDGANAGRTYEIESNDGNIITLAFPSELPFVTGVAVRYRPGCSNLWAGPRSCETYNNRLNYRGEPHRPVADTASLMVPKPSRTE